MNAVHATTLTAATTDGHRFALIARIPERAERTLLWLPALGVAAKHYLPFAEAFAQRGVATFLHEWRGHGSSDLRAGRDTDWGYRELLLQDLPAAENVVAATVPDLPRVTGGHSLGGQLACCRAAIAPGSAGALWLVGSGAPYWRAFPPRQRWWLPLTYRLLPWLADIHGALPGRRLRFGGNEARGVIRDWSRTALSGRYAAAGLDHDLERALRGVTAPVHGVVLHDDWLAPASSLRFLLSKMSSDRIDATELDAGALGAQADHFAWMRTPGVVAETLVSPAATPVSP